MTGYKTAISVQNPMLKVNCFCSLAFVVCAAPRAGSVVRRAACGSHALPSPASIFVMRCRRRRGGVRLEGAVRGFARARPLQYSFRCFVNIRPETTSYFGLMNNSTSSPAPAVMEGGAITAIASSR